MRTVITSHRNTFLLKPILPDAWMLYHLINSPSFRRGEADFKGLFSYRAARQRIIDINRHPNQLRLHIADERYEPFGSVLLSSYGGEPHALNIGISLLKKYEGRGHATAAIKATCKHAFAQLGCQQIVIETLGSNHQMIAVALKCGFKPAVRFVRNTSAYGKRLYVKLIVMAESLK